MTHGFPTPAEQPEVCDALGAALLVAAVAEWADARATALRDLANRSLVALLACGLVDAAATDVLYAGAGPLIPLLSLRLLAGAGDAPPASFPL